MINRKFGIIMLLVTLCGGSCYFTYQYLQPFQKVKIKERELRIKPHVTVDPSRKYRITLWDYDWPLAEGNYRKYLQNQILDFKRIYPNITVKLRLLDLQAGPGELSEALRKGEPPDVYCSALETPAFDYKYQVPVGPYFAPKTHQAYYFPGIARLTRLDGVQCFFPRWVRPDLWVGNRGILEGAGLSIAKIQTQGWSWDDILRIRARLNPGNYLLAGNILPDSVLQRIGAQQRTDGATGVEWEILQKIRESNGVPPDSEGRKLEYFCSGKVALLAGVKPVVWRYLRGYLAKKGMTWETVVLPVPSWPMVKTPSTVELGMIGIYRQRRLGGDEQVAAALKLGEYLSRCSGNQQPWVEMMVVPAARIAAADWAKQSGSDASILKLLEPGLNGGNWHLPLSGGSELSKIKAVIEKYLSGKLSRTAMLERLQREPTSHE